jgi:hypothetical protein
VVIGLTSWTSIYGWVDPQWQAERQAAAQAPAPPPPAQVVEQSTVVVTQEQPAAVAPAQDPAPSNAQALTPVEQRVQEAADPSELPRLPTLDIDFRETP